MTDITFLDVSDVLMIHDDTLQHEGGLAGVRDPGLLEAAVAMPRQQFGGEYLHEDLAAMTAAYHYHIAQNHPFLDGNKRAATMTALAFLRVNAIEITPPSTALEAVTLRVASGDMSKEALTRWWRSLLP